MSAIANMASDPRTVDELVNAAHSEPEDAAWEAVCALHFRGTKEVLLRAGSMCDSECPQERHLSADILGQLGVPTRTFPEESFTLLLRMLEREADAEVLQAIFVALSHLGDLRAIPLARRFSSHPDPEVRYAVVLATTGHDDRTAIDLLIEMTRDVDPLVRDWATFALGSQLDVDSSEIRTALAERLADADDETRGEALVGLARRGDRRVVPILREELAQESVGILIIEAAEVIGASELYPALIGLRERLRSTPDVLERAIAACKPE
jgi:HEAT repeat protein